MTSPDYDVITIGGGVGGSALATVMAEAGARVLVLERETNFSDRIRGEWLAPWGVAEAEKLGIYSTLKAGGAHDLPGVTANLFGPGERRDFPSTTPQGLSALTFFHPDAQEALLAGASDAGVEVRRGVRVTEVRADSPPQLTLRDGSEETRLCARIIVSAEGRTSLARKALGLDAHSHRSSHLLAGVLLEGMTIDDTGSTLDHHLDSGRLAYLFPQGNGRVRAYVAYPADDAERLQGKNAYDRFVETSVACGIPAAAFDGVTIGGPLATFTGDDTWVDHPYRAGVALLGDAAGVSDPTWGQGLSLAFRDARALRDALVDCDDWDAAGDRYAEEHDQYFQTIVEVENWLDTIFLTPGSESDAIRARALPRIAEDPSRIPDHIFSGPDLPAGETTRRRFYGED